MGGIFRPFLFICNFKKPSPKKGKVSRSDECGLMSATAAAACRMSCSRCRRAENVCHGCHNILTLLTACNTRRQSTCRCRIEVAGGERHVSEDFARIGCRIGKNTAFTVGDAVFGGVDEKRNGSFNLNKREKSEGYIKTFYAHIFRDRSTVTATAKVFGNLVNRTAASAAMPVSVGKFYGKDNGRSNFKLNLGCVCYILGKSVGRKCGTDVVVYRV